MKKLSRYCLALCLSFAFGMTALQASTTLPAPVLTTTSTPDPRTQELTQRLEQIQAMDKSQLTSAEKKALRKEVKQIKHAVGGGVYLSVGAIILIVVLLILLL